MVFFDPLLLLGPSKAEGLFSIAMDDPLQRGYALVFDYKMWHATEHGCARVHEFAERLWIYEEDNGSTNKVKGQDRWH